MLHYCAVETFLGYAIVCSTYSCAAYVSIISANLRTPEAQIYAFEAHMYASILKVFMEKVVDVFRTFDIFSIFFRIGERTWTNGRMVPRQITLLEYGCSELVKELLGIGTNMYEHMTDYYWLIDYELL